MTWDNYGRYEKGKEKWQIDHIIPQSKLLYDSMDHSNFRKCWALENLRPLEVVENIRKSNKTDFNFCSKKQET
jgi:5-methylcytosine-specific restriction endonuclease McrA